MCFVNGCDRSFSSVKQYFRHIISKHLSLEEKLTRKFKCTWNGWNAQLHRGHDIFSAAWKSFAPKDFDLDELKYVLNLFTFNNVNRTSVYQKFEEDIKLAKAQWLDLPFDNLTSE